MGNTIESQLGTQRIKQQLLSQDIINVTTFENGIWENTEVKFSLLNNSVSSDNKTGVYNGLASNLPNTRAAIQRVRNGSLGDAPIVFIGDSMMQGAFASGTFGVTGSIGRGNGSRTIEGWLSLKLNNIGINTSHDTIFGPYSVNSSSYSIPFGGTTDSRITSYVGWTNTFLTYPSVPGNAVWVNSTSSSSFVPNNSTPIVYNPIKPWNVVDIYFLTGNGNPTCTFQAGSSTASTGNVVNINGNQNAYLKYTYTAPTQTTQSLSITITAGAAIIGGVSFRSSTIGQVQLMNCASSGTTYSNWNYPYVYQGGNVMSSFLQNLFTPTSSNGLGINPCCVVMMSDHNDAAQGISSSSYQANVLQIINLCQNNNCDVIMLNDTPLPTSISYYNLSNSYRNVLSSIAYQYNVPFIDLNTRLSSYNLMTSANIGYMNQVDGHPTGEGYNDISTSIFNLLTL